jgi:hypothetical protein
LHPQSWVQIVNHSPASSDHPGRGLHVWEVSFWLMIEGTGKKSRAGLGGTGLLVEQTQGLQPSEAQHLLFLCWPCPWPCWDKKISGEGLRIRYVTQNAFRDPSETLALLGGAGV